MFNNLDKILNLSASNDEDIVLYWYEIWFDDAIKILKKFTDKDWEELMNIFPKKSNLWKERLIYCLCDHTNIHQLNILQECMKIDDSKIYAAVIKTIYAHNFTLPVEVEDKLIQKMDTYLPELEFFDRDILEEYCDKIKSEKSNLPPEYDIDSSKGKNV